MTTKVQDDPLSRLEQAAHRDKAEADVGKAVSTARARLVLGKSPAYCFFATLALRLKARVNWNVETCQTDGKHLDVDPDWFVSLPLEQAKGVVAHETLHNALGHPARRQHRDLKKWDIACDLAVNPTILESGLQLPAGRLMPGEGQYAELPAGKSAEWYYENLPDPKKGEDGDDGGGQGQGQGDGEGEGDGDGQGDGQGQDPGGCGAVQDPGDGSQAAARQCEADWEVATAQAHQIAKQRGNLPQSIDQLVQQLLAPKVNWKDVLREFVSRYAKNDYAWHPPNRRFIHQGIYLPGLRSEELGEIVVALDESGSISDEMLRDFGSELQGILDAFDCQLTILHHDTHVQHVEQWQPSEGPLVLTRKCCGGTSHRDVFDWINKNVGSPTCVLCLTDLYTDYPNQQPEYPVLWTVAAEGVSSQKPPFGAVLEIK